MNEDMFKALWTTIQPIFLAGCTFLGMATILNWLKKRGFIGEHRVPLDRRKLNDETLTQLLKMYDQNTKYLHELVQLNIKQNHTLEQTLDFNKEIKIKVDDIHKKWLHA